MTRIYKGAKVRHYGHMKEVEVTTTPDPAPPNGRREALLLALDNRHKPWARRWLKYNGHWNYL